LHRIGLKLALDPHRPPRDRKLGAELLGLHLRTPGQRLARDARRDPR
jgi:hypothetical protein